MRISQGHPQKKSAFMQKGALIQTSYHSQYDSCSTMVMVGSGRGPRGFAFQGEASHTSRAHGVASLSYIKNVIRALQSSLFHLFSQKRDDFSTSPSPEGCVSGERRQRGGQQHRSTTHLGILPLMRVQYCGARMYPQQFSAPQVQTCAVSSSVA